MPHLRRRGRSASGLSETCPNNIFLDYELRAQRTISGRVGVLPYIKSPTRKTRAEAMSASHAVPARRDIDRAICHPGTVAPGIANRIIIVTGAVGGNIDMNSAAPRSG